MDQVNPQDNDVKEAYEAFKAYKAFKSQQSQVSPDSADKASRPKQEYLSPGESATNNYWTNVKARITDPERYKAMAGLESPAKPKAVGDDLGMAAGLSMPMEAAPAALSKLATYLGSSAPKRIATNAGVGAIQGAVNNPNDRLGGALKGGGVGLAASLGGEAISGVSRKIADYLMQRGVGTSKYIPGMGNTMADEGLIGTRPHMENQIAEKYPEIENQLQQELKSVPGQIDSNAIADEISKVGNRFINPDTGNALANKQQYLDQVRQFADQIRNEGNKSAIGGLAAKRGEDWVARTAAGNVGSSLESELSGKTGDLYREALDQLTDGKSAELLGRERALATAGKAVKKPLSLPKGLGSLFFTPLPGEALLDTALGQGLQKGSGLVSSPVTIQSLAGSRSKE